MSATVSRVDTGVPGLDEVIGGGLLPGALVFLVGAPGAGKTVLVEQISFHAAVAGTVLYFTTLSEPHTKLIANVRDFAFFDEAILGERLQFLNLEQMLRQGAEETVDAIVQMARAQHAVLVVIDGFRSVADFVDNPVHVREFLYQIAARLAVVGTTCIVTFEGEPLDRDLYAELSSADVIVGIWPEPGRLGQHRRLAVLKARGSAPLSGSHSLHLSTSGSICYPQAEALPIREAPALPGERAVFGLPRLDVLLSGGLTAGTTTMLAGSMGAGKTVLALTWLVEGARRGERGLLVGFQESGRQLLDLAAPLGIDLSGMIEAGMVTLDTRPPVGLDPNEIAARIRACVESDGVRRLVIDSERQLEHSVEPRRVEEYMAALIGYLRGEGITALFTVDVALSVGPELDFVDSPAAALAENIIQLRRAEEGGRLVRALAVTKMRFSGFDPTPCEYAIGESGFDIGRSLSAAYAAPARPSSGHATGAM